MDNLTWIRGAHTLKTGVSISDTPDTNVFQQFHFGQYVSFGPDGLPTEFTVGAGPGSVRSKDNIYGVYIQDTWKLTPRLAMNYGVRYDYEAGTFKGGDIGSGGGCLQGNGIIPACSSDNNNIQPRLGLVFSPDNKTVISAGFGEITQLAFMNISLDSLNFDGVTLFTVAITDPSVLAFFPDAPPANVLAPFIPPAARTEFGRIRPIADKLHNPETRDVHLSIRRQIGDNWVVGASYIGAFGFGQFGERDRNFPAILADPAHPGFFYFGDRPDSRFTAVRTNENSRTSNYNGLVVQASKRLSNHFQFQTSYTWSHTFSSAEDFYGTSEPGYLTQHSREDRPCRKRRPQRGELHLHSRRWPPGEQWLSSPGRKQLVARLGRHCPIRSPSPDFDRDWAIRWICIPRLGQWLGKPSSVPMSCRTVPSWLRTSPHPTVPTCWSAQEARPYAAALRRRSWPRPVPHR